MTTGARDSDAEIASTVDSKSVKCSDNYTSVSSKQKGQQSKDAQRVDWQRAYGSNLAAVEKAARMAAGNYPRAKVTVQVHELMEKLCDTSIFSASKAVGPSSALVDYACFRIRQYRRSLAGSRFPANPP